MDTSKYKALYLQETHDHLSGIEKGLLLLDKEPGNSVAVDSLFRHYHSIKGMSASMGYEPLARLAHAQEDLLDRARSKKTVPAPETVSTLLECLDALRALVKKVEGDEPLNTDISPFLDKITRARDAGATGVAAGPATAHAPEAAAVLKISDIMKVEGRVFDDLLATVGDLFMSLSAFKSLTHGVRSIEFKDNVHALGRSINSIYNNILSARMLPVEDLTEGLPRVVRDISRKSGKEVDLKIEGAEIRLDRSILEGLGSPMVHIIRNAVDHGIESRDERLSAGKPASGTISVRAYAEKDRAVIEVSDDGHGIDPDKLKAKAVAKGFPQARLASMTGKEALMLVCVPGLSTSDNVTETSGRGVGMDVVKEAIEGLGGSLEIESVHGEGTKIIMKLPRTSSIVKSLLVADGAEQFLLPMSRIIRAMEVNASSVAGGTLDMDGVGIPVIGLGSALGIRKRHENRLSTVILVDGSGAGGTGVVGVVVDSFLDEIDAYVKPLTPPISRIWGVSGITIMGDGRPVFLLDLTQIISRALAKA
ncbi:MAG: Hpt domain-containing protein [Deltaproteobacteria bacterium]|nr:Hpt domain-containing protein [Deltaproteobacteria bacterium]